jgi:hypothetical protein
MQEFGEIGKLAIQKTTQLTGTVDRVLIARDYHVAEWLAPAISSLDGSLGPEAGT